MNVSFAVDYCKEGLNLRKGYCLLRWIIYTYMYNIAYLFNLGHKYSIFIISNIGSTQVKYSVS